MADRNNLPSSKLVEYSRSVTKRLMMLFVVVLPFDQKISSIILGILLIFSIVQMSALGLPSRRHFHWFLPALFLYYLVSELLSDGSWVTMVRRLLFLGVPLVFAVNHDLFDGRFRKQFSGLFIIGNLATIAICIIRAFARSLSFHEGLWHFNSRVIQNSEFDFLTSSIMGGNYFFGQDLSPFMDPIYFGMYIVLSMFMLFQWARTESDTRRLAGGLVAYLVFWGALFLLSSKSALIAALLLAIYMAFHLLLKGKTTLIIKWSAMVGLAIGFIFVLTNPRVKVFTETFWERMAVNPNARFGHDLRILSWDASLEVIKTHWLVGVGEGRKEQVLLATYESKGYVWPVREQHNSHNQYLDFLLGGGVLALTLFLTGLLHLMIKAIKQRNGLLLAFILLFAFNALIENLLSRYAGILLFSVFTSFCWQLAEDDGATDNGMGAA